MMELCQYALDGRGMPDECKTSVIVPVFEGKGDMMSCGPYRGVKLLEHDRRNILRRTRSCICVLLTLKKLLIECQEK